MGEACKEETEPIEQTACDRNNSWPLAIKPEAAEKSRDSQHKNTDSKGERDFGNTPAELLGERRAKNAPRINRAQCDLQKNTRDGNTPTIRHDFLIPWCIKFADFDSLVNEGDVQTPARSRWQRPRREDYLYW